jgi:hypothetical protein
LESKKLDALLEQIRKEPLAQKREELRSKAKSLIAQYFPVLTLYSPYYFYAISPRIHLDDAFPKIIGSPEELFARVYEWFIITKRQWQW